MTLSTALVTDGDVLGVDAALPDGITHVAVGFSRALLADLDPIVPARSVLVLEEPDIIAARNVVRRVADHRCVGALRQGPTQSEDHAAEFAVRVTRPADVRAVIPAVEYGVVTAAALAEQWGLPGAGLTAARRLRDKARLRRTVGPAVPQPDWLVTSDPAAVAAFRAAHGAQCVLKPTNRQASLGVQLIGPDDDVWAAVASCLSADEPLLRARHAPPGALLVESLLDGDEFSHEAIVQRGGIVFSNLTAKRVLPGPRPVETGHVVPAPVPASLPAAVRGAVETLVRATGFADGVLHSEWIVDANGTPHLVECAGRLPGDGIDVLIDLAYPGSLLGDYLAALEGADVTPGRTATATAGVRFVTTAAGVVQTVRGVDAARAVPGVTEVVVDVVPGEIVGPIKSSWDRRGHITVRSSSGQACLDALDAAAARLVIAVLSAVRDEESGEPLWS